MSETENVFDKALAAASDAFSAVLNERFGRKFDGSPDDEARLMDEYRVSAEHLRGRAGRLSLRTGLVDADFTCWLSGLADENFGPEVSESRL